VSRGELDAAVVFSLARTTGLDLTRLGDDRYRVLLPASHPVAASGEPVPLERLAEERWIMPRGAACSALVGDACRRAGFVPRIVLATDDHATARRLVAEGVGIAAVPALLGLGDDGDTVLRDTDPAPCRALHVALAARARHPPELPALRDALLQAYRSQAADVERPRSSDPR
jgi:DNA-binding transcriptional LysR family regulator